MSTHTAAAPGNRTATMLDLASLHSGDVVTIFTNRSRWDFVLTKGREVTRDSVIGVAVMTNSRKFGQMTSEAMGTEVDRIFRLGESIGVSGGNTGDITMVLVNSVRRLG